MIRRHPDCPIRHRSWRTLARCVWPRAAWVIGEGTHALVAQCLPLTVCLYPTRPEAQTALDRLNAWGCGGTCTGQHSIESIDPQEQNR